MSQEFDAIIGKLTGGEHLSRAEARAAVLHVMSGTASDAQITGLLVNLAWQRVSVEELVGAASVMREKAIAIDTGGAAVLDTCGTGGDVRHTFNISTAAAIIAAACGVKVVKHGNRSASGRAGSADVLEKLGVGLELPPARLRESLEAANICFAFAGAMHPAMKHVRAVRKALGVPTIFNLLGPLTNPGRAALQLVGVFSPDLTERLAAVLGELGSRRAWVVHAADGLDEISTLGPTRISELSNGRVVTWMIDPAELGLPRARIEDLQIPDLQEAAAALVGVLEGKPGPKRDIAVLNAAAAIVIAGKAADLKLGLALARGAIDSGAARKTLDELIRLTR
jgi:anthranilate phosphoribosyltransferase